MSGVTVSDDWDMILEVNASSNDQLQLPEVREVHNPHGSKMQLAIVRQH